MKKDRYLFVTQYRNWKDAVNHYYDEVAVMEREEEMRED